MTDMSCDQFRTQSAELALGVLDGRDRSDAVAHLERCPACRHELLLMSDLADRIVGLAPAAEPPAGFETRVLASLTPTPRPTRRRRLALVLTAAGLAAILGVGGWVVGHRGGGGSPAASSRNLVAADLVTGSRHVGRLIASTGAHPWISMDIDTGAGDQRLVCQLRERDGTTLTLGSFTLGDGYGYWAAPVPPAASPIIGARLVDAGGRTVATAAFSTPLR
jgi:anti-sigma factor RsiW